jgi:AcrR family transcriptional regulator
VRPSTRAPAFSAVHEQSSPGLRERKKAKTRAAIQAAALHLFERQGYQATTVDQIAEMAEVSQSTFFRYFPSKEDVVLLDRYDPLLLAALVAQPAELSPIAALRRTLRSVLGGLPAEELERERQRAMLIVSVPELRARALDDLAASMQPFAEAVAERTGRPVDDSAVRALTGAVLGVSILAMLTASQDPSADWIELMDTGLAHLEAGLDF